MNLLKFPSTILCVLLVIGSTNLAFAQTATRAASIEGILSAPTLAAFSPPIFSADERFLAYVVTNNARKRKAVNRDDLIRSGVAWYGVASDIWVADLQTKERRNITNGGHNWSPSWSPDGRYLAFLADRSELPNLGPARLWLWERASGKLRQASDAD